MVRDPQATRRALLAAARREFAEHGVAGARVDRIAATAGVNKERIYGHFGGKAELFVAVLADSVAETTAAVEDPADRGLSDYVARKLQFHGDHPEATRLLLWETLERPANEVAASADRLAIYERKARAMAAALDCDERQARYAMMLGLALGTIEETFPVLARIILGEDYDRTEFRAFVARAAGRAAAES